MIQYNFIPQIVKGKVKIVGTGLLTISNKEAMFFTGEADKDSKLLGTLKNPEVISITSKGIFLKGYEPVGFDKTGRQQFKYQEWFCSFIIF